MSYQGWTNYETWAVALWIDNEEGSHLYWLDATRDAIEAAEDHPNVPRIWKKDRAAVYILADRLKDEHEDAMPEVAGVWGDLLTSAIGAVDWNEIAEHFIEAAQEAAA